MNTGITYLTIANDEVNTFLKSAQPLDYELLNNDYVIASNENGKNIAILRVKGDEFKSLSFRSVGNTKKEFNPLNYEQECAFDLLCDDDVKIKVLTGIAGTGKTKLAIKFGLDKLARKEVEKIMLVRNPSHVGQGVGFHKGDKTQKVVNWNNPIKDNMDYNNPFLSLDALIQNGKIELDIPSEMKGRDLKKCWIIVDEAEDLTIEQFKMLGERVSEGSYIVFAGDTNQVTEKQFKENNGLKRVFGMRGKVGIFGSVELKEDVRSDVSRAFALIY